KGGAWPEPETEGTPSLPAPNKPETNLQTSCKGTDRLPDPPRNRHRGDEAHTLMPFFQPQKSGKVKRRLKAYPSPTISGLEDFLGGVYSRGEHTLSSDPLPTHNDTPTNMGRRMQKAQSGHPAEQPDIGALLQRQAQSKMATEAQQTLTTTRAASHTPTQTENN
ncbi:Hypothetical predicted protein, partial [Pelobates cultripes]